MIKPINNFVLLKVKNNTSEYKFENGLIIYMDTSYLPDQHTPIVCEVVQVPDHLLFDPKHPQTMPWRTDMELIIGDEVIIYYISYDAAFKETRWFELEGEQHFFINYQNIYLAKRHFTPIESEVFIKANPDITKETMYRMNLVRNGDTISQVIMLNGFILCEPHEIRIKTSLILPEYLTRKKDAKILKVAYTGSHNREYIMTPSYHDDPSVESGDWVVVERDCDVPLEYSDHKTFYGDLAFYRLQRCLLHGVVKNREAVL